MSKSAHQYLRDILLYLDKIVLFTSNGRDEFFADEKTQFAVIRAYEVVGEIVKRLPAEARDNYPQVDWRTLAGFRDFLAHNYDEIVLKFVWQAVTDINVLRASVQKTLDSLPPESE